MTTAPETAGLETPPEERPAPNGIGGGLLLFGLLAMIATPLFLLDALAGGIASLVSFAEQPLSEYHGPNLFMIANIAFTALLAVGAFLAGYFVYSGSFHGRRAAVLFFLLMAVYGLVLLALVPPEMGEEAQRRLSYAAGRGVVFPVLWLLYFGLAKRCRNNYDPKYRHIPIRKKPLSRLEKCLWILWGAAIAVAAAAFVLFGLAAAGNAVTKSKTYRMDANGKTIAVPSPHRTINFENVNATLDDYVVVDLYFASLTPHGMAEYSAGYCRDEDGEDWDPIRFTYFKNGMKADLAETIASGGLELKSESNTRLVFKSTEEVDEDNGKGKQRIVLVETYLLLKGRIIRLTTFTSQENAESVKHIDSLADEWTDKVVAANQPTGTGDATAGR